MIVKAVRKNFRIAEVAISQRPAADADRMPRLRTWRDGWRHLRLLLLLSPRWLFFNPGRIFAIVGAVLVVVPLLRSDWLGTYAMLFGSGLVVCGAQLVGFALVASVFGERMGFSSYCRTMSRIQPPDLCICRWHFAGSAQTVSA